MNNYFSLDLEIIILLRVIENNDISLNYIEEKHYINKRVGVINKLERLG